MNKVHIFDVWRKVTGETSLGEDNAERKLYAEGVAGFYVVQKMQDEDDEVAESVAVLTPCIFTSRETDIVKGDEIRNIRWRTDEPLVSGKFEVRQVLGSDSISRFSKHATLVMKESK